MIFIFVSFMDYSHVSHFLTMGRGSGEDPSVTTVLFLSTVHLQNKKTPKALPQKNKIKPRHGCS